MRILRSAKGAISIFLCLILLPMVTYSTMIIDATRVQTSRASIASAGDLAMNAALSEYEQVLEDMYGLFAVAQSEEDFKLQLQAYFTQTIESKIMNGNQSDFSAETLSQEIIDAIFSNNPEENITNLIDLNVADFDYSPVSGSTLANQAIMKRQVIEYMKYKGPVSLTSTLFSKLDFLKDSSKQTEVIEKKVEYTQTLNSLQEACEAAWKAIEGEKEESTDKKINGYNPKAKEYADSSHRYYDPTVIESIISNSKLNYEYMSRCILMNNNSKVTNSITWDSIDISEYESEWGISYIPELTDSSSLEDVLDCMSRISAAFNQIVDLNGGKSGKLEKGYVDISFTGVPALQADETLTLEDAYNSISVVPNENQTDTSTAYKVRLEQFYNDLCLIDSDYTITNGYISSVTSTFLDNLKLHYYKQNAYYDFATANDMNELKVLKASYVYLETLANKYNNAFQKYLVLYKDKIADDNPDMNEDELNEEISKNQTDRSGEYYYYDWMRMIMNGIQTQFYNTGYKTSITNFISKVGNKDIYKKSADYYAKTARGELTSYYLMLDSLVNHCDKVINALTEVENKIKASESKKEEWQGKINNVAEGSTKSTMQSDLDTTTDGLNLEDVTKLKSVVQGIKSNLKERLEQVCKFSTTSNEVVGIKFLGISPVNTITADSSTFSDNAVYRHLNDTEELDDVAAQITNDNFDRSTLTEQDALMVVSADLIDGDPLPDEQFYITLRSICEPYKSEVSDEQKNAVENINDAASVDDEGNPTIDIPDTSTENSQAGTSSENSTEKSHVNIGEIYSAIASEANVSGEPETNNKTVRGMDVSTEEKEDYDDDAQKAENSLKAATSVLESLSKIAVTARDYAYLEEYFTEMFTCRTHSKLSDANAQTLLNGYTVTADGVKGINTNTEWYGKEIEYIIWGNEELDKNLTYTDAWIYVVRFALNAIYAFTAADIQSFALELATAIAGWTVIGVPIVQACITIALALAESAYDIHLLHEGKDVAIYKSNTTFVCSPTGLATAVGQEVTEKLVQTATKAAEDAIDKKLDQFKAGAYSKMDDAMTDVNNFLDDYAQQQADSITSSVIDQFVTPLLNAISPVLSDIDNTKNDAVEQLDKNIEDAFNSAWEKIHENINNDELMPEGLVKKFTLTVYEYADKGPKDELLKKIKDYYHDIINNNTPTNSTESLRAFMSSTDKDSDGKIIGIIPRWVNQFKDSILDEVKNATKEISDKVKELGDEGVDNIKSVLHEEIGNLSSEISGSITTTIQDNLGNYVQTAVTDTATSGGFTLNYKEYCKIIVFIKLIEGKENVMLNRAATLIQANVVTAKVNNNENFKITNAYTLVGISARIKMGTLFSWAVQVDENSEVDGTTNTRFDFSHLGDTYVYINYNAVNGY